VLSAYAVAAGVLGTIPVVTIVTAVMIAFAARMLSSRLHRKPPRTMLSLTVVLTVLAVGLAVNAVTGEALPDGAIATVTAAVLFARPPSTLTSGSPASLTLDLIRRSDAPRAR
jgi:hypothetical protein